MAWKRTTIKLEDLRSTLEGDMNYNIREIKRYHEIGQTSTHLILPVMGKALEACNLLNRLGFMSDDDWDSKMKEIIDLAYQPKGGE